MQQDCEALTCNSE